MPSMLPIGRKYGRVTQKGTTKCRGDLIVCSRNYDKLVMNRARTLNVQLVQILPDLPVG
jgi:hypothetical protein